MSTLLFEFKSCAHVYTNENVFGPIVVFTNVCHVHEIGIPLNINAWNFNFVPLKLALNLSVQAIGLYSLKP